VHGGVKSPRVRKSMNIYIYKVYLFRHAQRDREIANEKEKKRRNSDACKTTVSTGMYMTGMYIYYNIFQKNVSICAYSVMFRPSSTPNNLQDLRPDRETHCDRNCIALPLVLEILFFASNSSSCSCGTP